LPSFWKILLAFRLNEEVQWGHLGNLSLWTDVTKHRTARTAYTAHTALRVDMHGR